MCVLCRSLFVLLYFFFWSLCCVSFFDLRILITPLVSSNSSYCLHAFILCLNIVTPLVNAHDKFIVFCLSHSSSSNTNRGQVSYYHPCELLFRLWIYWTCITFVYSRFDSRIIRVISLTTGKMIRGLTGTMEKTNLSIIFS